MKKFIFLPGGFLALFVLLTLIATLLSIPTQLAKPAIKSRAHSYIVQGANVDRVVQLVEKYEGTVTSRLNIVNGVGALLVDEVIPVLLAEPEIRAVTPNASVHMADAANDSNDVNGKPTADYSEVVGANNVWAEGVTGNITVAVIDTGLKSTLPGINKNTANQNRSIIWQDFVAAGSNAVDPSGHGSHVTGIIVDSSKGDDDAWNGIAPNIGLVNIRVLNGDGFGTYESVIQGIQWVLDNKDLHNIKVLNLSLVATPQSPYWADPLNQAVMGAWAGGITVVAAAGNTGPLPMSIGVPGNNPYVISVGAFTDDYSPNDWSDDYITPFSATGPTLDGFVKPDVVAPGAHMVSTMQASANIAKAHKAYKIPGNYFSMAGTSQATAVVSGIAALILSQDPLLTPDQVKYRIMHTALLWTDPETGDPLYSVWQQGAGRVNAPDAVFATTTESANYGLDIQADLAGTEHYEGFTYYDETTDKFRLRDDESWPESYSTWDSGYSTWAGGYSTWAGGYSTWAGGYSTWAGGYSTWAGGYSTWAGGYSTWAGGYSTWAGGYSTWAGSEPWANRYGAPAFVATYASGESPDPTTTTSSIGNWIEERDWDGNPVYIPFVLR